jgi:hypothetical protein
MQKKESFHVGMIWALMKDFKLSYVSKVVWAEYIQQVTSVRFTRESQSSSDKQNPRVHGSVTTHTSSSILFLSHAKRMV